MHTRTLASAALAQHAMVSQHPSERTLGSKEERKVVEISKRAAGVKPSPTLTLDREVKSLTAAGHDIVNFGIGEPDFDTPDFVIEQAISALHGGATKYTATEGTPGLRLAIRTYLERQVGLSYGPDEVMATVGAKHALANALLALVNPGDGVLVPAPYWVSYPEQIRFAGGTPVFVATSAERGYRFAVQDLERAYTGRVRGLILNSPNNPTGAIIDPETQEAVARFAMDRDLWVISDEIYHRLVYGPQATSIARVAGMRDRTVVINGVSKSYAMTGWRIGFAAGPAPVIQAMIRIQGQMTSNPATIAQAAAEAALQSQEGVVEAMRARFQARRTVMLQGLARFPHLQTVPPDGAFYVFVGTAGLRGQVWQGKSLAHGAVLAHVLLNECGVAVVPGGGFGEPEAIRLSFAQGEDRIREGLKRMGQILSSTATPVDEPGMVAESS